MDAVHLVIPPALHAPMSVQIAQRRQALRLRIPMEAHIMKELEDVIKAWKASGKHYMFIRLPVYLREVSV